MERKEVECVSVECKTRIKVFSSREYSEFERKRYQAPSREGGAKPREYFGTALINMGLVVEGENTEIVYMQPSNSHGFVNGKAFLPRVYPNVEKDVGAKDNKVTVLVPDLGIEKKINSKISLDKSDVSW